MSMEIESNVLNVPQLDATSIAHLEDHDHCRDCRAKQSLQHSQDSGGNNANKHLRDSSATILGRECRATHTK